jgi:hypothetical protein
VTCKKLGATNRKGFINYCHVATRDVINIDKGYYTVRPSKCVAQSCIRVVTAAPDYVLYRTGSTGRKPRLVAMYLSLVILC